MRRHAHARTRPCAALTSTTLCLLPSVPPPCSAFDEVTGVVKVRLAGSCVGCPSSSATLRNGVENMLCHYIPEVKKIEEVVSPVEEEGNKELKTLEDKLAAAGAE